MLLGRYVQGLAGATARDRDKFVVEFELLG
jgi:hypothetical protein